MKLEKTQACSFRLWTSNADKLEQARKLGLNSSEIVNEVLSKYLPAHLSEKAKEISRALAKAA